MSIWIIQQSVHPFVNFYQTFLQECGKKIQTDKIIHIIPIELI